MSNDAANQMIEKRAMQQTMWEYAGFWRRFMAHVIDTLLIILFISIPATILFGGSAPIELGVIPKISTQDIIGQLVMAGFIIAFWVRYLGTPGKMAMKVRIVHEDTRLPLSIAQASWRFVAYLISTIPFGLGFIWIAFDSRKQGWHDKLAKSVVIHGDLPADHAG